MVDDSALDQFLESIGLTAWQSRGVWWVWEGDQISGLGERHPGIINVQPT